MQRAHASAKPKKKFLHSELLHPCNIVFPRQPR